VTTPQKTRLSGCRSILPNTPCRADADGSADLCKLL
jgi:hypothetical protein